MFIVFFYIYIHINLFMHIYIVYIDNFFPSVFPGHEAQLAPLGPGGAASLERGHDQGAMAMAEAMGKPWTAMGNHGNHGFS